MFMDNINPATQRLFSFYLTTGNDAWLLQLHILSDDWRFYEETKRNHLAG